MLFQGELGERYSVASESGSSTDSHAETCENKDGESSVTLLLFVCLFDTSLGTLHEMASTSYLYSEEEISVQQPHEHWQEEKLFLGEPREVC